MIKKLPLAEIGMGVAALLLAGVIYWYAHRDEGSLEDSKVAGAAIVAALEQYRSAEGSYPDSLPQLVPGNIASIPAPTWGLAEWKYRRFTAAADSTREYFQLSVAKSASGYPVLFYDITFQRWVLNN